MPAHLCPHCGAINLSRLAPCRSCGTDPVRAITATAPASAAEETTQPVVAVIEAPKVDDKKLARGAYWYRAMLELGLLALAWCFMPKLAVGWVWHVVHMPLVVATFISAAVLVGILRSAKEAVGGVALAAALWAMFQEFGFAILQWSVPFAVLIAAKITYCAFRDRGVCFGPFGPKQGTAANLTESSLLTERALACVVAIFIPVSFAWDSGLRREAEATVPVTLAGMTFDKPKAWTTGKFNGVDVVDADTPEARLVIKGLTPQEALEIPDVLSQGAAGFDCGQVEADVAGKVRWSRWLCSRNPKGGKVRTIVFLAVSPSGEAGFLVAANGADQPIEHLLRVTAMARTLRFEPARSASAAP